MRRIEELNVILVSPRFKDLSFLSESYKTFQELLVNSFSLTQTIALPGIWKPVEHRNGSMSRRNSTTLNQIQIQ